MKIRVFFFVVFAVLILGAAIAWAVVAQRMSVQVRQAEIRERPSFLGKVTAKLSYGESVSAAEEIGGWKRVTIPATGQVGWVHESALSVKNFALKAGEKDVVQAADGNELALAGKGFNKQVEGQFKNQHPEMDYKWVDRMETFVVSHSQMKEFLNAGNVSPQGGM